MWCSSIRKEIYKLSSYQDCTKRPFRLIGFWPRLSPGPGNRRTLELVFAAACSSGRCLHPKPEFLFDLLNCCIRLNWKIQYEIFAYFLAQSLLKLSCSYVNVLPDPEFWPDPERNIMARNSDLYSISASRFRIGKIPDQAQHYQNYFDTYNENFSSHSGFRSWWIVRVLLRTFQF